jgi:hypothetical protein
MTSTIKVNNIQNQCGANIANKCGTTITLGASGDTITLASGASQTGFGRTGTVDWDTTAKTASFTAVSGTGYFVNTTSGAVTVTLPAGSAGDIVGISDYASTFQTNNVTITPNGTDKINGTNSNANLSTQGLAVSLVYVDATRGWKSVTGSDNDTTGTSFITATGGTITTCGNCKIHTFTGPGTFSVAQISSCSANNRVSYVVVAGGGAGGDAGARGAGGGGAGGFREDKSPVTPYTASPLNGAGPIVVTATSFPITVGAGGAPSATPNVGGSGGNSIFSTITSAGGGGGGGEFPSPAEADGVAGGSGGGGGSAGAVGTGASGNTPPVSPPQGNGGGDGNSSPPGSDCNSAGGGGGGATVAGTGGASAVGGNGGNGATTSINASPTTFAGGGGGSVGGSPTGTVGSGGTGGGGCGGSFPGPVAGAGTTNTGGGGGGSSDNAGGGAGGSGIVIIRYKFQ